MKYRILLNDDKRSVFEEVESMALSDYPQFTIEYEQFQDRCLTMIREDADKYDAIILDANGIPSVNPAQNPNKEMFLELVEVAQRNGIRTYIYSGTLNIGSKDSLDIATERLLISKGFRRGKDWFSKSAPLDSMLDRISDDLDEFNSYAKYYKGYEYLLDLVFHGWLKKKDREEFLDPIMKVFSEKDMVSAHGNQMRNILHKLLHEMNLRYGICEEKNLADVGYYGSIISKLEKQRTLPASLIIGPLWCIHKNTNARSHDSIDERDRKLFFDADFSSFFLVTRWFAKIMEQSDAEVKNMFLSSDPKPLSDFSIIVPVLTEGENAYFDLEVRLLASLKDRRNVSITRLFPVWRVITNDNDNDICGRVSIQSLDKKTFTIIRVPLPRNAIGWERVAVSGIQVNDEGVFIPSWTPVD